MQDRVGNDALKFGGQEENDQRREEKDRHHNHRVKPEAKIQFLQIGLNEHGPDLVAIDNHLVKKQQRIAGKSAAVRLHEGRRVLLGIAIAGIAGEGLAVLVVNAGCDDMRIRVQRGKNAAGRLLIVEQQGAIGVVPDHVGKTAERSHHGPALGQHFVADKGGASQEQGDHAGQHDDPCQLAFYRQVLKLAHPTASPRHYFPHHRPRLQKLRTDSARGPLGGRIWNARPTGCWKAGMCLACWPRP